MAITTSSKAKTKTSKKPARTAKATTKSSKSVTKKVTPTKTSSKANAKPQKVAKVRNVADSLKRFKLINFVLFTGLAVAAVYLMTNAAYTLTVSYLTADSLASQSTTVFAPGTQGVWDVQVRYALAFMLGISALFAVLYATVLRKRYQQQVTYGVVPLRWIDLGVTLAIMAGIVAALSGAQDMVTLKLVGGLMIIHVIFAYLTERRHVLGQSSKATYVGGLITALLPIGLIVSYAVNTSVYGMVRYPWYVYALQATLLIGFVLFAKNQYKQIKLAAKWRSPLFVEKRYLIINMLVKTVFAIILIVGLQK